MSAWRRNTQSSWNPLPFAVRKTDSLLQRLALYRYAPSTGSALNSDDLAAMYGTAFSAIARSGNPSLMWTLSVKILKKDPVKFFRQLARWATSQTTQRLRSVGREQPALRDEQ